MHEIKKHLMQGPSFTINFSCNSCAYCKSEYYSIEDGNDYDSGFENYCTHKLVAKDKPEYIGLNWQTPKWCPLLLSRLENARKEIDYKIDQMKKMKLNSAG